MNGIVDEPCPTQNGWQGSKPSLSRKTEFYIVFTVEVLGAKTLGTERRASSAAQVTPRAWVVFQGAAKAASQMYFMLIYSGATHKIYL